MRTAILLLSVLLVVSTVAIVPSGLAQDGDEAGEDRDGPPQEPGKAHGHNRTANNSTDGDATYGNGTSGNGSGGPGKSGAQRPDGRSAAEHRERRDKAIERYREAQEESREENREALARLPDRVRDRMGAFEQTHGHIEGRHVSFDASATGLANMSVGQTRLFDDILFPSSEAPRVSVHGSGAGNRIDIRGEDWRLGLTDAPPAPIRFDAEEGAGFRILLAEGTEVTPDPSGARFAFPAEGDTMLAGHITGDVSSHPTDTRVLLVDGDAQFFVSAERTVMDKVANKARAQIEESLARGHFGAEVNVLRSNGADDDDAVPETVVYNDMTLDFAAGEGDETPDGKVYTITVDAEAHEGKTIAVNFESGLLDPERLRFSYFNVDGNRTIEATIVQADDIHDVLDPTDDGTIAEYWVVSDVDGIQVLVSIPHFSVHKIQIQSLADVIVEHPSLVLGALGAVVVVAAAAAGMVRPPKEEE